jgi:GNAT superfamily N-acetyltransferase
MGASKEQPFTIRDTIRDFMHSGKNDIRNDDCGSHELIADRRGMVLIEAVLPFHIEQIRSLFVEYAESLSFNLCFQSFDEELRNLPGYYSAPNGRLLLAYYLDDPAGCIALRPLQPGICEMKRLYVRPSARGRGLGKILVQRLIAEARAIGYERMRLDTIQSDMADAIALYRKLGFREIEPYSKIPNESALWMELLL